MALLGRLGIGSFRARGFLMILGMIVFSNLFWWAWVNSIIRARPPRTPLARRRRLLSWIWTGYCGLMLSPFALMTAGARGTWDSLPVPVLAWTMTWHLLLAPLGGAGAMLFLLNSLARGFRGKVHGKPQACEANDCRTALSSGQAHETPRGVIEGGSVQDPPGLSRRALLAQAAAAAPLVITGGSVLAGRRQEGRFLIREVPIRLPRLPERLKGLTITHLSDLHVGRFFRPEHLPRMVDAANKLRSDIVAITGDMVDHSNDFLPAAVQAFSQLEAPLGRFVVIGNHDLMDMPQQAELFLARHERHFLRDEFVGLDIGGERAQIAGLFWSRSETRVGRDPGHAERARTALAGTNPDALTIALVHHPHAFEALAANGADLVLAGHTHGGQIMLTPPGLHSPLGAGNLLFRYIHGTYAIGQSRMYVSAGVGNWFPLRVNAPAEMVKIRLI